MADKAQTFNDGLCAVYAVTNDAQPGNMPHRQLTLRTGPLRFSKRTVGMSRFWQGKQAGATIDMLIRVQRVPGISTHDIAVLHDGTQFSIEQIQEPEDVVPPAMDLSLQRVVVLMDFAVSGEGVSG